MVRFVSPKPTLSTNTSVGAYICISCNLDNEAKKPWLLQRVADPPNAPHNVLHTLALATDSSASSETELTTERRLDRLEKKFEEQAAASRELQDAFRELNGAFRELHNRFENHEKVMQDRMEEVFRLLHQVLAHKVQSNSG